MNPLYPIAVNIFKWCHENNIDIILARPLFQPDDFKQTDLDIVIKQKQTDSVIGHLRTLFQMTFTFKRTDGVTTYFYDSENDFFFHIDFIESLQIRGIEYLHVNEVMNRRYKLNDIFYLDPVDQFLNLVLTNKLKHKNLNDAKYDLYLKNIITNNTNSTLSILNEFIGEKHATRQYESILLQTPSAIPFYSFLITSWKRNGLVILGNLAFYLIKKINLILFNKSQSIAFLGVDGAGKTTLINALNQKLQGIAPRIIHAHFIPALPWKKQVNSNNILNNPHEKPFRGYILSSIKLGYLWLRYMLADFKISTVPSLYLYDRYIYDIIVDKKRYRYNGPSKDLSSFLLKLFPKPVSVIYLDISAELAYSRKQEVSKPEINRQIGAYCELISLLPSPLLIKSDISIQNISNICKNHIIQSLDRAIIHDQ